MTWNHREGALKEACRSTTMVVAVAAFLVMLGSAAWATTTLSTGYLTNGGYELADGVIVPLNTFVCSVVSTKPKPVDDVTFELVRADGTTIVSSGSVSLNPGDPRTIFWESAEPGAYCRVSGKISKHRTHITLCNSFGSGYPCLATVTAP